jgi:hypothetical protein
MLEDNGIAFPHLHIGHGLAIYHYGFLGMFRSIDHAEPRLRLFTLVSVEIIQASGEYH